MQPDYFTYLSNLCSDLMYNDDHKTNITDIVAFVLSFYDRGFIAKDQRNLLIKQIYGDEFDTQSALNDIKIAKNLKTLRHNKNIYYIIKDLKDPNTAYLIADSKGDAPYRNTPYHQVYLGQIYLGNILVDKDRRAAFDFNITQKALQKTSFWKFCYSTNIYKKHTKANSNRCWASIYLIRG